ncbi:cytochrome c biogenesis protein CcdA [Patescibacteria group bacterium]
MKKVLLSVILVVLFLPVFSTAQEKKQAEYFYSDSCSHCQKVGKFFDENSVYDKYEIIKYSIDDPVNSKKLGNIFLEREYKGRGGIPAIIIDNELLIGDETIISYFKKDLGVIDSAEATNKHGNTDKKDSNLTDISLTVLIGAALVDAINPCAFAVLIVLVATVIGAKGRKKALVAGLLFSLTVFVSYLLIGLGLYKAITVFNLPKIFSIIIGVLAVLIGLANLKDAFWHGKVFLMEVPMTWRPKMKSILTGVTSPLGAIGAGFLVSLFLLPCTSGPYVIILGLLAERVALAKTVSLLVLYNLIFILPMIVITLVMYFGFRAKKLEELRKKNVRLLHAVGGTIMLLIGAYLIYSWI